MKTYQVEILVPGAVIPTVVESPLTPAEIRASLTADGFSVGFIAELPR